MKDTEPILGVVGGMGPYAGLALVKKVFDHTVAHTDQEHVPVLLFSFPNRIPDRSAYLSGKEKLNPAYPIADILESMERVGVTVAGIPCNTAHVPRIFDVLVSLVDERKIRLKLLHIVRETVRFIQEHFPGVKRVGVLSTLAAYRERLYAQALEEAGYEVVVPDETVQTNIVERAIFDPDYGIKAKSDPVSPIARQGLLSAIEHLREKGAELIVLGCTEIPLAIPEAEIDGVPLVDPMVALGRALLRESYPEKLREL